MPTFDPYSIFTPTKELDADTAYLFAGRQETLLAAVTNLAKPGGCVAIFGERGVGKSSLGRILIGLLNGRISPAEVGLTTSQQLPRRACIRISWNAGTQSLEHLLYGLFDPGLRNESSFAKQFPKIAELYRARFDRIKLDGLTGEGSASDGRLRPNQVLVHNILNVIEDAYTSEMDIPGSPINQGLVIAIDEMDQATERGMSAGLGGLIKNSKFQFITIGIGEAITDILEDHLSSQRKFDGGQFLIKPLTNQEVRELFAKASAQANHQGVKLIFEDEFCDLVANDFSGYPAQIQAFGLDIVLNYRQRLGAVMEVRIRAEDYLPLLKMRETSPNRDIRAMNFLDAGVNGSVPRWEVLKTVVEIRSHENSRWITLDKLRLKLHSQYHTKLRQHLKDLVNARVLEAQDELATTVNIASPAILVEINRRIREGWEPKSRLNK